MTKLPASMLPQLYAQLMEEVKERLDAVEDQSQQAQRAIGKPAGYIHCEYAYLQIRKVIELIGIAVLLAHNEIDDFRTRDFMKAWNAEALFGRLEKLSNDAFPEPATEENIDTEKGSADLLIGDSTDTNRRKLKEIYLACSEGLHAGSLSNLIKSGGKRYDIGKFVEWKNFIVSLLNHHVILLPDRKSIMIVIMSSLPKGAVHCRFERLVENDITFGQKWEPR
ncbi:hypothetical protein HHL08_03320 [Sphingobium sp. AR-3-1]|uniref:Uncharacterized protein n=1 Tax=Sphingobium psychrophilum TaxID=2728834 RepID=A0A7X9WSQ7_9SPHN|nr:hypothetical protein [Sphingobium psychrophilum]NML09185.1 hypothetical protein [Sphingobium psychrophilum]